MGRSVLMTVLLMTTIYAGILTSLNRKVGGVPDVLVRNQLEKELENVSDFALRNAIRNANSQEFLDSYLQGGYFADERSFTESFSNFKIGNCYIDSLRYSYSNSKDSYKVESFIRGEVRGISIRKNAEMAFHFPFLSGDAGKPNILYLEMERLILFPWLADWLGIDQHRLLPDSSGNNYQAYTEGWSLLSATIPWGGAFSKYCTKFNGINNYIRVEPQINEDTGIDSLNTDNSFSMLVFAKIDKNGRPSHEKENGTLLWVPSEPNDTTMRLKPSAAIWYDQAKKKMVFEVTQDNAAKTTLKVEVSHTPNHEVYQNNILINLISWTLNTPFISGNMHKTPWNSYAITYNNGLLKAFIDGRSVGSAAGAFERAYPSLYGMTYGRRDLRGSGIKDPQDYRYFCGVMDQTGIHDKAMTDSQILSWHNGIINATEIKYIRD